MDAKEDVDEVIPTKLEDFGYHFNKGKHPYDTQTWILGGGGGGGGDGFASFRRPVLGRRSGFGRGDSFGREGSPGVAYPRFCIGFGRAFICI